MDMRNPLKGEQTPLKILWLPRGALDALEYMEKEKNHEQAPPRFPLLLPSSRTTHHASRLPDFRGAVGGDSRRPGTDLPSILLPETKTLPGPDWLKEGVRLTYYWGTATMPARTSASRATTAATGWATMGTTWA